ncbi:FHA domain-containing protein [Thermodesulfobacteriota bacterium]
MSTFAELECTCTRKALRKTFPIDKGKYVIGRCSKAEVQGNQAYYAKLPDWARELIKDTEYSISLRSEAMGRESGYISRAQIWLEVTDEFAKIVDLHSKNKTFVNGSEVQANEETYEVRYVFPEDLISIGSGVANLRYRLRDRVSYKHHAMLVGWAKDKEEMEIVYNNIESLKKEIAGRGFAGNIEECIGHEAIKENILAKLERMGKMVAEDSILLFYFVGDARPFRSCKLNVQENHITSDELFKPLMDAGCQKLFIIDGPRTSSIAKEDVPPKSILIGNRQQAGEGEIKSRNGFVMRYLTHALCKALEGKEKINVKSLMEQVEKDALIHSIHRKKEIRKGTLIELPPSDSVLSMAQ